MAQRPRTSIYPEFEDGERPSGADFRDLIDSYINIVDDPLSIDTNNNIVFSNAIRVGTTTDDTPGSIRYTGSNFEFRGLSGWEPLGSGGAFSLVGSGDDVAYNDGNVGISTGATPTPYKLQVAIEPNNGEGNQVRIGSSVIHDSQTTSERAYFSHYQMANNSNFGIMQLGTGRTHVNAPTGQSIRFTINFNRTQMAVVSNDASDGDGFVVVGSSSPGVDADSFPEVRLFVRGDALKTEGGGDWETSDVRLKKDISEFNHGLDVITKINPIKFRYNGKAWTKEGKERIGVSGQDIEKIAPYMVSKVKVDKELDDKDENEYLVFNSDPLIYLAINAIKELSERIDKLEK